MHLKDRVKKEVLPFADQWVREGIFHPIELLDERCHEANGTYADKMLGLRLCCETVLQP